MYIEVDCKNIPFHKFFNDENLKSLEDAVREELDNELLSKMRELNKNDDSK